MIPNYCKGKEVWHPALNEQSVTKNIEETTVQNIDDMGEPGFR